MTDHTTRLQSVFNKRENGEKIMSLFITAGYPELDSTPELILGFEKAGADIIEIGMPFSDPLADGPTIQYSNDVAIKNGITMKKIIKMVRDVRKSSEIPIVLMGYINPVMKYGIEAFCKDAAAAGADALIIPDVPVDESKVIHSQAINEGLSMIYLVAPNTSAERMKLADQNSNGFVYCVSVTGVTGAREGDEVSRSVEQFIERVNENVTINPKMIGFGIKNHNDAKKIAQKADGFIVGSALIENIRNNYPDKQWKQHLFSFVKELKFGNI